MNSKEYSVQDKIPIGKALIYENLKDGDFVIDIGKRFTGIEKITNTIIRIPKSVNKEEYWQKLIK